MTEAPEKRVIKSSVTDFELLILKRWIEEEVFHLVPFVTWWSDFSGDFIISYPKYNKKTPKTFKEIRSVNGRLPRWLSGCVNEGDFFQAVMKLKAEAGEMQLRGTWDVFVEEARKSGNQRGFESLTF